jgi:hypothetical protein
MIKKLWPFLAFGVVMLGAHFAVNALLPENYKHSGFVAYHIFLLIYGTGSLFGIIKVAAVDKNRVGMAYLATSGFKMLVGAAWLLIAAKQSDDDKMIVLGHFFSAFFLYLICEVLMVLKILQSKTP